MSFYIYFRLFLTFHHFVYFVRFEKKKYKTKSGVCVLNVQIATDPATTAAASLALPWRRLRQLLTTLILDGSVICATLSVAAPQA